MTGSKVGDSFVMSDQSGFSVAPADSPRLAQVLDLWAMASDRDAMQALDEDAIGRAARLRGKAEGLRIAAAELRREAAGT